MSMTATQAQQLYVAYFNRPADTLGLAFWTGKPAAEASAAFASSPEYAATYAGMSTAARVDAIYNNLFGRSAEPTGLTYWGNLIDRGLISVSNAVTQIANGAQGTDLTAYNNKVTAATAFTVALDTTAEIVAYSGTTANVAAKAWLSGITTDATLTAATTTAALNASVATVTAAAVVVTAPVALTTSVDNLPGTAGNDTFIADNTGTTAVMSAADSVNGGAGTDTLKIFGAADVVAQISSVENVIWDSAPDAKILNLSTVSGVSSVTVSRVIDAATVKVGAGVAVTYDSNTTGATASHQTVEFAAADTSANLIFNKTIVSATDDFVVKGAALATLNIATTGAASTIDELQTKTNTAVTTINVTGDQNLTITTVLEDEVTKVDATNFTGKLSVVGADIAQTVNGGTNDDTVDLRAESTAKTMTVSLGAGNDTLRLTAANFTAADVLTGGDGATDTLALTIADAAAFNTDVSAKTSGFEVLEVVTVAGGTKAATLDVNATKLGVTSLKATATTNSDTINFSGVLAASTITIAADVAVMSAALSVATGTSDVLNIGFGGTVGGIDVGTSFTAANIERINIESTGGTTKNTVASLVTADAKDVVVTGSGKGLDLTLTDVVAGTTTFNSSGYSGPLTLVATAEALKSITTGSGADLVTVGAGTLAQTFTAAGGTGIDKLVATASADQNLGIIAVTGFETIELSSTGTGTDTVTADFRNVTELATLKLTAGDNGDIFALRNFGTATIAADNDTIAEINIQSVQAATSLKLGGAGNTTVTTLTLDAGATTLNVESVSNTSTITNIAGGSLTTINLTGAGATTLDATPGINVTTINAGAATGVVTATLGAAGTLTGGTAGDVLGGSSGKDTINAGAGNDNVTAGGGADAINVGSGTDTVTQAKDASGAFVTPAGNSISTTNFDVVTGLAAGDLIDIEQDQTSGAITASNGVSLAGVTVADGTAVLIRGTYDAANGTFGGSGTGLDSLLAYDADGTDAGQDVEAIILVGYQGTLANSSAVGTFTLA